jgi:hypothetical protein
MEHNNAHFVRNPTTNETLFIALLVSVVKRGHPSIPSTWFRSQPLNSHHVRFLPDKAMSPVYIGKNHEAALQDM